jgi:ElaB/YqjD/DUF883 family membrane-anchored ribosome-binding protein
MRDRAADRAAEGLNQAADQGRRLVDSARDMAERAGAYAQTSVSRLSDRAQHVAGDFAEDARDQLERFTGREMDAWASDVRRFVQERPLQAILITAAIGYVLGKLLRRA